MIQRKIWRIIIFFVGLIIIANIFSTMPFDSEIWAALLPAIISILLLFACTYVNDSKKTVSSGRKEIIASTSSKIPPIDRIPDIESSLIIGCAKCKSLLFEHDSYFDEYICLNCGWATQTFPQGVDKEKIKEKGNDLKSKQEEFIPQVNLADQLQIGMSLNEITRILGPSTASMGGGEVMGMTQDIRATMPGSLGKMMGGKTFVKWDRPEGIYQLVIENNRLARVFSVPDKTVEQMDGTIRVEEDMPDMNTKVQCDMCNNSFEERDLLGVGIQDFLAGQIKDLKVCNKCHIKIVEQASGMYTR